MRRPVVTTAGGAQEPSDLPDHVVLKMLHREVLLTKAKLHALNYEHAVAERKLRSLKSQLRQVSSFVSGCFIVIPEPECLHKMHLLVGWPLGFGGLGCLQTCKK